MSLHRPPPTWIVAAVWQAPRLFPRQLLPLTLPLTLTLPLPLTLPLTLTLPLPLTLTLTLFHDYLPQLRSRRVSVAHVAIKPVHDHPDRSIREHAMHTIALYAGQ